MRKIVMVLLMAVCLVGVAVAQEDAAEAGDMMGITVRGNLGLNYTLEDLPGEPDLIGFPVQLYGLYRIPQTIEIEDFGDAVID